MTDAVVPSVRPFIGDRNARQGPRRCSPRVAGPFDGRRMGAAVRIYELNIGGCQVECDEQVAIGRRICLQIDLAGEGWISVEAETVLLRQRFGFAVTFVRLSDANRARIERTIERLHPRQPKDVWDLDGAA